MLGAPAIQFASQSPGFKPEPEADLGFPRGRQPERETPSYYLANFPENCMKMKKIGPSVSPKNLYYVDPPQRTTCNPHPVTRAIV